MIPLSCAPAWMLTAFGFLGVATWAGIRSIRRNLARLAVREPESPRVVLYARLIPSPRELPGRPLAACTARPLYVITDLPGPQGARVNRED